MEIENRLSEISEQLATIVERLDQADPLALLSLCVSALAAIGTIGLAILNISLLKTQFLSQKKDSDRHIALSEHQAALSRASFEAALSEKVAALAVALTKYVDTYTLGGTGPSNDGTMPERETFMRLASAAATADGSAMRIAEYVPLRIREVWNNIGEIDTRTRVRLELRRRIASWEENSSTFTASPADYRADQVTLVNEMREAGFSRNPR